MDTDTRA
jgi:hypothetical protein